MNNKCIKVGIVNYLNTAPLLYGLQQMDEQGEIALFKNNPAAVADALIHGEIDLGLIPVAMIPKIANAQIVGNHCISSFQKVASVCLFSQVPISEITTVYLDYQSRTSVQLVQILLKQYWKKNVEFKAATPSFINEIKDTTAAVIIGDRALEQLNNFAYVYDLAEAWHEFASLPFVFAVWVSRGVLDKNFIDRFENANKIGLDNLALIAAQQNYNHYDLLKYYTQNICYVLDENRKESLQKFLNYLV
jgi:chorismate dehydratase